MEEPKSTTQNNQLEQKPKKKNRGRYSLPKDKTQRMTGKTEPYAYTVKDKCFGEFKVLSTANAWWREEVKVYRLIEAYKIDANDDEACYYAGISLDQLRYFRELHSDFYRIKHACGQHLGLIAKKAFAKDVERDGASALEYLKMKRKDEGYSTRTEQTGANGRDLYDGLTKEIKDLGEQLRSSKYEPNKDTTKEHTANTDTDNPDAGQAGGGDDSGVATNETGRQDIPDEDGKAIPS